MELDVNEGIGHEGLLCVAGEPAPRLVGRQCKFL